MFLVSFWPVEPMEVFLWVRKMLSEGAGVWAELRCPSQHGLGWIGRYRSAACPPLLDTESPVLAFETGVSEREQWEVAQHHPLHPSACFRSDPRSLPSKADGFGACSLFALEAQALHRSKGSRNDLISFPLIFFSFPSLHLQRQEEKIQPHTHVLLSWTRELVGEQPGAQGDLHSHKPSLSTPVLPQEWRACSSTDPPIPEGGRQEAQQSFCA